MAVATDERRVLREASGRASSTHLELQVIPVVRKSSLTLAAVKSDAVPICRLAEVAQSGQETHVDGCADVTRQYDGASGRLCSPCIGTTAPYARGRVVRPLLQSSFFYSHVDDHGTEVNVVAAQVAAVQFENADGDGRVGVGRACGARGGRRTREEGRRA